MKTAFAKFGGGGGLISALPRMRVFRDLTLCCWLSCSCFESSKCLLREKREQKEYVTPKQATATLRNAGNYSSNETASHSSNPPNRLLVTRFLDCRTQYRGADKSLAPPGCKQARKHVSDAGVFNNIETRAVIKFFFLQGKAPKEIRVILTETLACFLPGRAKDLSALL